MVATKLLEPFFHLKGETKPRNLAFTTDYLSQQMVQ